MAVLHVAHRPSSMCRNHCLATHSSFATEDSQNRKPAGASASEPDLKVIVVLEVDLLQAVHLAQHAGHGGQAIPLQANRLQVWQPSKPTWQACIGDPATASQQVRCSVYSSVTTMQALS